MVPSSFIAAAVGNQYKAALENLANVIQKFPEELWAQEKSVCYPSWRLAYHIIYYAKFYLSPRPYEMQAWPEAIPGAESLGGSWEDEPEAPIEGFHSRELTLSFLDDVLSGIGSDLSQVAFEATTSLEWYPYDY